MYLCQYRHRNNSVAFPLNKGQNESSPILRSIETKFLPVQQYLARFLTDKFSVKDKTFLPCEQKFLAYFYPVNLQFALYNMHGDDKTGQGCLRLIQLGNVIYKQSSLILLMLRHSRKLYPVSGIACLHMKRQHFPKKGFPKYEQFPAFKSKRCRV